MSEAWRKKAYYKPRVLIDVDRVLSPQFGDSMLCITGPQLELLRNLMQYLHRRSTFVAEYHDDFYLCADNDDYDALQAIVAELEETLMGCEEITAALDDIANQLACLCAAANRQLLDGELLAPIVDGYLTDGTLVPGDVFGGTSAEEDERCALAQLVYWQAWQVVVNLIGPLDELAIDLLLPALLGLLGTLAGGPLVGVPAALLIMLVRGLIEAKNAGMLPDILSTWEAAQKEIICAVYRGLETGYREAERLAMIVIADLPVISPVDKVALHCLVCPWAIMVAKWAMNNETDFAAENVEPGYCVDCEELYGRTSFDVTWPPCEGPMFQGTGFCAVNEWKCSCNLAPDCSHLEQIFKCGDATVHSACTHISITMDWYSALGGDDQPAGWYRLYKYRTLQQDWIQIVVGELRTDSVDPMTVPSVYNKELSTDLPDPGQLLRIEVHHTRIEGSYPTDVMLGRYQMECTMTLL